MIGRPFHASVRGLKLQGLQWGDEGAPGVLAVHGWMDNAASFEHLGPGLAQDFHVIAIDLPGHGLSEHRPLNAEYHYVDWVLDVSALLDELGWASCVGVGHSMGAGVLALAAGAQPERFERVVLIEGLGPFTTSAVESPENLRMALKSRRIASTPTHRVYASRDLMVERRLVSSPDLDAETAAGLMTRGVRAVDDGYMFAHDPRLKSRSVLRFTEPQVQAFLGTIACPVLLIRAEGGLIYDPEAVSSRLSQIADLRTILVEGGHHVHLAHPDRVVSHVCSFAAGRLNP